ncbi:hypothetical protein EVJ58_g2533 [Rhodofomes roseus]|uniref:BAG domain-containing protein n=1 Tax=Rhodofomes roseus TaxID=34475 RepID=A0A4Y9YS06_9APHY|nr:hypothetical protein EVJ58_g2533 [Rhodofomes roseus]
MLVLTPVSAFSSGYYPYPVVSPVSIQNDYLEAVAQARAEAVRRHRQQELRRKQIEEQNRQAAFEAMYQQQVLRERQRRLATARQCEEAYVRALIEAQERERAEQLTMRRAREQQLLSAVAALGSMLDFTAEAGEPTRIAPQMPRASSQPSTSQVLRAPSPVSSARERLQQRLERESDPDVRDAVEGLLSVFPTIPPVDRKGKGKAREVPMQAPFASSSTQVPVLSSTAPAQTTTTTSQPASGPSLKDALRQRMHNEADPEIKESLNSLFTKLYGTPKVTPTESAAPSSSTTTKHVPVQEQAASEKIQDTAATTDAPIPGAPLEDGAGLHRQPALPPAVAAKILSLHRSRRAPAHLARSTFSPSPGLVPVRPTRVRGENALMYTSNNRAVHSYEHALSGLLERLDAVDSRGDLEVRGRRKEVVKEVERALRDVERKVEERSREREREGARTPMAEQPVEPQQPVAEPSQVDAAPAIDTVAHAVDPSVAPQDVPQPTETLPAHDESAVPSPSTLDASAPEPSAPQPSTADLSYAASTLDIPVASVLPSPSALSPSPTPVESTPEVHAEVTSQSETEQPAQDAQPAQDEQPAQDAHPLHVQEVTENATLPTNDTAYDKTETSSPTGSSSSENDAFLLSSHPLQDPPRKSMPQEQEHDEPEIVTLAEAEADNSGSGSEWSEVEA